MDTNAWACFCELLWIHVKKNGKVSYCHDINMITCYESVLCSLHLLYKVCIYFNSLGAHFKHCLHDFLKNEILRYWVFPQSLTYLEKLRQKAFCSELILFSQKDSIQQGHSNHSLKWCVLCRVCVTCHLNRSTSILHLILHLLHPFIQHFFIKVVIKIHFFQPFSAAIVTTLLGRLNTKHWNIAVRIWKPSATRAFKVPHHPKGIRWSSNGLENCFTAQYSLLVNVWHWAWWPVLIDYVFLKSLHRLCICNWYIWSKPSDLQKVDTKNPIEKQMRNILYNIFIYWGK